MTFEVAPFRTFGIDRADERRTDTDWISAAWQRAAVVSLWRGRSLISGETPASAVLLDAAGELPEGAVFLGIRERDGRPLFAVAVDAPDEAAALAAAGAPAGARFTDLRPVRGGLPPFEEAVLSHARALLHWHRETRHCAACGAALQIRNAGHLLACTAEPCGRHHFPRTDPATIVLVYDGDRALLGRNAEWPSGRYSTLAGFVEPGESLEDSVAREVFEEAGVRVDDIVYAASQPWPYPRSLMLGFFARAVTVDVRIGEELEDARWFSRDEVRAMLERGELSLPGVDTIARRLIEGWLAATPGAATPQPRSEMTTRSMLT